MLSINKRSKKYLLRTLLAVSIISAACLALPVNNIAAAPNNQNDDSGFQYLNPFNLTIESISVQENNTSSDPEMPTVTEPVSIGLDMGSGPSASGFLYRPMIRVPYRPAFRSPCCPAF